MWKSDLQRKWNMFFPFHLNFSQRICILKVKIEKALPLLGRSSFGKFFQIIGNPFYLFEKVGNRENKELHAVFEL